MSEELLSAMFDGECTPAELQQLLDAEEHPANMNRRWSRMCLVHEALAGTSVRSDGEKLCADVMAALDGLPDALPAAPLRGPAEPAVRAPASASPVVPASRRFIRRLRPAASLAAAASIGAAVVLGAFGTARLARVDQGAQVARQPARQDLTAAVPVQPPADMHVAALTTADPPETAWDQLDARSARELNAYVADHSAMGGDRGVGGSLSYARMAVSTAVYHTGDAH
jgi:negative regulator of sigma E activity